MTKLSRWLPPAQKVFWALFLLTLPVTSFPFFPPGLGGSTLVRPLALYPLVILLVIAVLPRLFTRSVPRTLLPFLAFALVALAGTLLSFLQGIDPVIGVAVTDRVIRNLVTLALGGAFYLTVVLIPETPEDLRFTLRWLYAGFAIALLWGSLQVVYILKFHPAYFDLLKQLQRFISIRRLFPTRVSGMTYEPNWFAEQIAFLLMPWLFTAVFSGYSVFCWRWRWVTGELLMLVWAAGVLLFTYSRAGLALLAVQLLLILLFRPRRQSTSAPDAASQTRTVRWKSIGKRVFQAGVGLVILLGVVFFAGSRNNYFSRLWNYWTDEESTGAYLQYIAFDQRFTYWETAYSIYDDHPLMGVGLGNYTFFFDEYLADRPLTPTPELFTALVPEPGRSQLTTVKSIFPRLLAETGLLGLATFLAFLVALLGCTLYLWRSPDTEAQFWGRAGLLGLTVFLVVSFSYDSFSLPNMWVVFGLITAAAHTFTQVEI
jgi:O-antigen ligase